LVALATSHGNSLRFSDLEIALRDQEEEFLAADHGRGGHPAKKRSFWIVEEGNWRMVVTNMDELEENTEIHWVGNQLPTDVSMIRGLTTTLPRPVRMTTSTGLGRQMAGMAMCQTDVAPGGKLMALVPFGLVRTH